MPVLVNVTSAVIVCVSVLTSVDVDVDEPLLEDVRVTKILFEITGDTEDELEPEFVLLVKEEPLGVVVDVPDFEFVVVRVAVFEVVDVLESKLDRENEDDAVEVLEILLDDVSLAEFVKADEYV